MCYIISMVRLKPSSLCDSRLCNLKSEMSDNEAACPASGTVEIPTPMSVASIIQIMENKTGCKEVKITTKQKVRGRSKYSEGKGCARSTSNSQENLGAEFGQDILLNSKGTDEMMVEMEEKRFGTVLDADYRRTQLLVTAYLANPAEYDSHSDVLNSIRLDPSAFENDTVAAIVGTSTRNELESGPRAIEGAANEISGYAVSMEVAKLEKYDIADARSHALLEKVVSTGEYQAEVLMHLHNEITPSQSLLMSKSISMN